MNPIVENATKKPGALMWAYGLFSLFMIALVALPTLAPGAMPFLNGLKIDTDPENMLSPDEPVRVYHNDMKANFGLNDFVVVGVVEPENPEGVFNVETLTEIYELTKFAGTLRWEEDGETRGVVPADIIAPSNVDSIEQAGLGSVSFSYLMSAPPETAEDAIAIREKAQNIPTLNGTLVSEDGKAIALYLPITSKDMSYRVASELRTKIAEFDSAATWHITGLPIAQDQFGKEMFKQMAISAPAAMLLIFILMWLFFRKVQLIIAPMLVAMVAVIGAMGLLVATGNTVHIMSSMIPIFVMPIAVLDAVHILSDFFDLYPQFKDRKKTLRHTMKELWWPMVITTVTTCAGFASLALTPIPPVQIFGIFVALGVFFAWLATVTMVPAYIMLMPEKAFENFGMKGAVEGPQYKSPLSAFLRMIGRVSFTHARLIIILFVAGFVVAGYGISRIQINDNPVKWFSLNHEIRKADIALNERFAGTYMAYLTLTPTVAEETMDIMATRLKTQLDALGTEQADAAAQRLGTITGGDASREAIITDLTDWASAARDAAEDDDIWVAWDDVVVAIDSVRLPEEVFKRPDMLHFVEGLQAHLLASGYVGKSNAVPDIVKTVHRELLGGEEAECRIPESVAGVAQTLVTFENSHRPGDLYKMVTPDYRTLNIWVQLKSGDNKDMNEVVHAVAAYMDEHGEEVGLTHDWFGLTYINTVWQAKMVAGMLKSFLGSFIIVLIIMVVMFRSLLWGLISMAPLTVTIAMIYGAIGIIGKDYDMPIAVLSSLSLGLAIDYAIHFNARAKESFTRYGNWKDTLGYMFGEPARAILRNVIVIGAGFLPLLMAPLVPYKTVGVFISAILVLAGIGTLIGLPAIITLLQRFLFPKQEKPEPLEPAQA
ncbi:efflux RND transporter permease subunit [Parvularcula marina]|uniref:RND transporter n=1 Tax=Parvularcula marina TaxID=2292771 RepID=A0A371REM9_9PROT|nr:MMPL family transporter [Parvularcula marina]RFB03903.1 RND transporter [Parvularcula marina]